MATKELCYYYINDNKTLERNKSRETVERLLFHYTISMETFYMPRKRTPKVYDTINCHDTLQSIARVIQMKLVSDLTYIDGKL